MKTPHHAILKAAEKRGIEIDTTGRDEYVFTAGEFEVRNASAKDGLAEMIKLLESADHGEADEADEDAADEANDDVAISEDFAEEAQVEAEEADDEDKPEGRSIVKRVYRKKYRPTQNTNGDQIAQELREYLETTKDDGSPGIDRQKLERFAKANGFWDDKYTPLNHGQVRMNVGNKLRAKLRKEPDWQPVWPK